MFQTSALLDNWYFFSDLTFFIHWAVNLTGLLIKMQETYKHNDNLIIEEKRNKINMIKYAFL